MSDSVRTSCTQTDRLHSLNSSVNLFFVSCQNSLLFLSFPFPQSPESFFICCFSLSHYHLNSFVMQMTAKICISLNEIISELQSRISHRADGGGITSLQVIHLKETTAHFLSSQSEDVVWSFIFPSGQTVITLLILWLSSGRHVHVSNSQTPAEEKTSPDCY